MNGKRTSSTTSASEAKKRKISKPNMVTRSAQRGQNREDNHQIDVDAAAEVADQRAVEVEVADHVPNQLEVDGQREQDREDIDVDAAAQVPNQTAVEVQVATQVPDQLEDNGQGLGHVANQLQVDVQDPGHVADRAHEDSQVAKIKAIHATELENLIQSDGCSGRSCCCCTPASGDVYNCKKHRFFLRQLQVQAEKRNENRKFFRNLSEQKSFGWKVNINAVKHASASFAVGAPLEKVEL